MNEIIKKTLIENLQSAMDTQSRIALELDVEWGIEETIYNKDDLENVAILFMHIIWNISAWYCIEKWFTQEQSYLLAEEIGKNMRQTIKLSTWVDLHNK